MRTSRSWSRRIFPAPERIVAPTSLKGARMGGAELEPLHRAAAVSSRVTRCVLPRCRRAHALFFRPEHAQLQLYGIERFCSHALVLRERGHQKPTIALVAEHFERVDQRIDQPHSRDLRASINGKFPMAIDPRC